VVAPLQINPDAFAKYANIPFIGNIGILGAILPLFWILPLILIITNKKIGYQLSLVFGFLLIYINILDIMYLISPGQFLFVLLYAFYFLTGGTIMVLSVFSLRYLRAAKKASLPVAIPVPEINHNPNYTAPIIVAILFALVDLSPMFLGARFGIGGIFGGTDYGMFLPAIAVLIVAIASGWWCGQSLLKAVWRGEKSPNGGTCAIAGAINGAIAQVVLYGFSPILIIAGPVGAVIGAIAGLVGVSLVFYTVKWASVRPAA